MGNESGQWFGKIASIGMQAIFTGTNFTGEIPRGNTFTGIYWNTLLSGNITRKKRNKQTKLCSTVSLEMSEVEP